MSIRGRGFGTICGRVSLVGLPFRDYLHRLVEEALRIHLILVLPSHPIKECLPDRKPHRLHLNLAFLLPNESEVVRQLRSLELPDADNLFPAGDDLARNDPSGRLEPNVGMKKGRRSEGRTEKRWLRMCSRPLMQIMVRSLYPCIAWRSLNMEVRHEDDLGWKAVAVIQRRELG